MNLQNDNKRVSRKLLSQRIMMKIKKVLLLLIVILPAIVSLNVSCSSNNDEAVETDNSGLSEYFLSLGYENCLMCHGSSDKNTGKNLTDHCLHFDPESYMKITNIDYSPTLNDCLLCHTPHQKNVRSTIYECGRCHYG